PPRQLPAGAHAPGADRVCSGGRGGNEMRWWGAVGGGVVAALGTPVLLEGAQFAGLTRLAVPLVYGSAFVEHRDRARAVGYAIHIVLGVGIALVSAPWLS